MTIGAGGVEASWSRSGASCAGCGGGMLFGNWVWPKGLEGLLLRAVFCLAILWLAWEGSREH